jgi:hypothetical protein
MATDETGDGAEPAESSPAAGPPTKRPSVGRGVVILLCVAVLLGIVGIVVSDSLRDATPEPKAKPTATASATPTPEATVTPTPQATPRLPSAPRGDASKTFTVPSVIGESATQAATEILRLAPSARLQFVNESGMVVEAQASYAVVATTPAAGEVTPTAGALVIQVAPR